MPTYSMKNTLTEEVTDVWLSMAEREKYLADNPHIVQVFTTVPPILDSVRLGIRKVDRGFNDVLQKAKGAHYRSTIDTR